MTSRNFGQFLTHTPSLGPSPKSSRFLLPKVLSSQNPWSLPSKTWTKIQWSGKRLESIEWKILYFFTVKDELWNEHHSDYGIVYSNWQLKVRFLNGPHKLICLMLMNGNISNCIWMINNDATFLCSTGNFFEPRNLPNREFDSSSHCRRIPLEDWGPKCETPDASGGSTG